MKRLTLEEALAVMDPSDWLCDCRPSVLLGGIILWHLPWCASIPARATEIATHLATPPTENVGWCAECHAQFATPFAEVREWLLYHRGHKGFCRIFQFYPALIDRNPGRVWRE